MMDVDSKATDRDDVDAQMEFVAVRIAIRCRIE